MAENNAIKMQQRVKGKNALYDDEYVTFGQMKAFLGQKIKDPVKVCITTNITGTFSKETNTLTTIINNNLFDGVVVEQGDRVLIINQDEGFRNGIYTIKSKNPIVFTRAEDANKNSDFTSQMLVNVKEGDINGDQSFQLINDNTINLNTTDLVFKKFPVVDETIANKRVYTIQGDGIKTEWEITHDLQTTDVLVQVIEVATNDIVGASVTIKGDSYITIKMEDIQLGANYKVIVIG